MSRNLLPTSVNVDKDQTSMDTTSIPTQDLSTDRPFRFMDLPTELRLYIAEDVLCANKPLRWVWLTSKVEEGFKSGTFKRLDSLTTFTRTSRPIHSETAELLWRLNTFKFGRYSLSGDGLHTIFNSSFSNLEIGVPAYEFFLRRNPETTVKLIPVVEFHIEVRWEEQTLFEH